MKKRYTVEIRADAGLIERIGASAASVLMPVGIFPASIFFGHDANRDPGVKLFVSPPDAAIDPAEIRAAVARLTEQYPSVSLVLTPPSGAKPAAASRIPDGPAEPVRKRRHLIRAYLDSEGKLHQQQFRIAYANKELVYFIVPGSPELKHVPAWAVMEDLPVALVMEKFRIGRSDACVYYRNPVPRDRLDVLEITFRSTAMAEKVRKAEIDLRNARDDAERLAARVRDLEAENAVLNPQYDREKTKWMAILETQAERINGMIADGKTVTSTFVHPGLPTYPDALKALNYRTATVVSARLPHDVGQDGCHLYCTVVFDDYRSSRFEIHDHALVNLYEYLIDTDYKEEDPCETAPTGP